jgi:hypothetical protein
MTRADIWVFCRYLEEHGHHIPHSCPNEQIIRKAAKAIQSTLIEPPILAPDFRDD